MAAADIINSPLVKKLVELAIAEDLSYGDPTASLLDSEGRVTAELLAKQDLVVCGLGLTALIASTAGKEVLVTNLVEDGAAVNKSSAIQRISGKSCDIVSIERTVLNFIQRLSGVATYAREVVSKSKGITVLDTRKTTPGFRILEKYATRTGGAKNHRMHLGEMIMVKNNHIDASEGQGLEQKFENLMSKIKSRKAFYMPFEIEIRNLEELQIALKYKPSYLLLDNMSDAEIGNALKLVEEKSPDTACEISGGIEPARFESLSRLGVKLVSMGALTTKATNVDISLRVT